MRTADLLGSVRADPPHVQSVAIEAGDPRTRQFDYLACWCDGGQRGTSRGRGIAVRAR
ncbi:MULTISPECIES: hypothetical protein [unclassified Frankia]|uniref:hypothetical protein n=1 Tax=unclassified Frankia TaxID=2632575 RepID=UPI002AD58097|nr:MULTISPECIES: hypothetical protein [unclassified Frankia]